MASEDCDQICCPKLNGLLKALLPKDAIKVDRYLTAILVGRSGPPCSFAGKCRGGGFDARKGGFNHPDYPVFNGECVPTNGTGTEKEADSEAYFNVHSGGQLKFCFFSTNVF